MPKINVNLNWEDSQGPVLNRDSKLTFNTLHVPFPLNDFIAGIIP